MAFSTCLARHAVLRGPRAVSLGSVKTVRTLSQRATPIHAPIARVLAQKSSGYKSRHFSCVPSRHNVAQQAPNPEAYLNSGAIKGARDLIDVKKVLVIGSGGLSIGQAGEFDYSGMCFCSPVSIIFRVAVCCPAHNMTHRRHAEMQNFLNAHRRLASPQSSPRSWSRFGVD